MYHFFTILQNLSRQLPACQISCTFTMHILRLHTARKSKVINSCSSAAGSSVTADREKWALYMDATQLSQIRYNLEISEGQIRVMDESVAKVRNEGGCFMWVYAPDWRLA